MAAPAKAEGERGGLSDACLIYTVAVLYYLLL
jgi:hypothetical protein